jgi:hypothetical protein
LSHTSSDNLESFLTTILTIDNVCIIFCINVIAAYHSAMRTMILTWIIYE